MTGNIREFDNYKKALLRMLFADATQGFLRNAQVRGNLP